MPYSAVQICLPQGVSFRNLQDRETQRNSEPDPLDGQMLWVLWRHIRWPLVNSNPQGVPDDQQNILFFIRRAERRRREAAAARGEEEVTNVELLIFWSNPSLCLQSLSWGMFLCLCVWFWQLMMDCCWECSDCVLILILIAAGWDLNLNHPLLLQAGIGEESEEEDDDSDGEEGPRGRMCTQSWECARNHRNVHTIIGKFNLVSNWTAQQLTYWNSGSYQAH